MLWRGWGELPELIRFLFLHFAIGVVLGWASALAVIWYDVGGIGSVLARYDSAALTALFFAKGGLYFGILAMSVAVMNLGSDGSGGKGICDRLLSETRALFGGPEVVRPVKVCAGPHPSTAEYSNAPRSFGRASG